MAEIRSAANELRQIEREMRGLKSQNLALDPSQGVEAYQYRAHWSTTVSSSGSYYIFVKLEPTDGIFGELGYCEAWLENVSVPDTDYLYIEPWWVVLTRDDFVDFSHASWQIRVPNIDGTYSGDVVVNSYSKGVLSVD